MHRQTPYANVRGYAIERGYAIRYIGMAVQAGYPWIDGKPFLAPSRMRKGCCYQFINRFLGNSLLRFLGYKGKAVHTHRVKCALSMICSIADRLNFPCRKYPWNPTVPERPAVDRAVVSETYATKAMSLAAHEPGFLASRNVQLWLQCCYGSLVGHRLEQRIVLMYMYCKTGKSNDQKV